MPAMLQSVKPDPITSTPSLPRETTSGVFREGRYIFGTRIVLIIALPLTA